MYNVSCPSVRKYCIIVHIQQRQAQQAPNMQTKEHHLRIFFMTEWKFCLAMLCIGRVPFRHNKFLLFSKQQSHTWCMLLM